jgi:hypothetical protein
MSPDRTRPPHNNLLHQTGRLPSCRRSPAPVAEEPRESLVKSGDEVYLLDQPSIGDACRLWAYPLYGRRRPARQLEVRNESARQETTTDYKRSAAAWADSRRRLHSSPHDLAPVSSLRRIRTHEPMPSELRVLDQHEFRLLAPAWFVRSRILPTPGLVRRESSKPNNSFHFRSPYSCVFGCRNSGGSVRILVHLRGHSGAVPIRFWRACLE